MPSIEELEPGDLFVVYFRQREQGDLCWREKKEVWKLEQGRVQQKTGFRVQLPRVSAHVERQGAFQDSPFWVEAPSAHLVPSQALVCTVHCAGVMLGAILLPFVVLIPSLSANPDAKRLYDDLLSNYNRLIRPVSNNTDTVLVKLGLRLSQLIDLVSDFKLYFLSFLIKIPLFHP